MKIISKQKDYYDSISYYGIDNSIVYIRTTEEVVVNESHKSSASGVACPSRWRNPYWDDLSLLIIGFCGKFHLCYQFTFELRNHKLVKEYAYDTKSVYRILKKYKCKDYVDKWFDNKGGWYSQFREKDVADSFFKVNLANNKHLNTEWFFDYSVPVFVIRHLSEKYNYDTTFVKNPNLKEMGFAKVVPPTLAYQQIASYISGVIGSGKPDIIEISDKDQMYKKGFNDMSFKTDTPGKKAKRRKKKK